MHVFKKYTDPIDKNNTVIKVSQSDSLPIMSIVPLQRVFWIGVIPQSIVYLPHSDQFIGYHIYFTFTPDIE